MVKIMGCNPVPAKNLSSVLRVFLERSGIQHALRVPVRMNGMTSSGAVGTCYSNVRNLVEVFGGKRVVGWVYTKVPYRHHVNRDSFVNATKIMLIGHAVWLNDENKLSDVTAKSWMLHPEWSKVFHRDNEGPYVEFIPWTDKDLPHLACEYIELTNFREGFPIQPRSVLVSILSDDGCDPAKEFDLFKLTPAIAQKYFVSRSKYETSKRLLADRMALERYKERERAQGKFTAKSTATGRTLDQIRKDRELAKPSRQLTPPQK